MSENNNKNNDDTNNNKLVISEITQCQKSFMTIKNCSTGISIASFAALSAC